MNNSGNYTSSLGSDQDSDKDSGKNLGRRNVLMGLCAAGGILALSGCETMTALVEPRPTDIIQRVMLISSQRAISKLTLPNGFWDSPVARINLPVLFENSGVKAGKALRSPDFREKLQHQLNLIAEEGVRAAAPLLYAAARRMDGADGPSLIAGGATAGTTFLRQSMGAALVNAMIPQLASIMTSSPDLILSQALKELKGVNVQDAAHALALGADNAIWYEVGAQEGEIRNNPEGTNEAAIIAAFKRP